MRLPSRSLRSLHLAGVGLAFSLTLLHPIEVKATGPSEDARALYLKGNTAFQEGDDVMARKYYRESLKVEESLEALCSLGRVEARSKLFAEAYEHLRLCVLIFPGEKDLQPMKANYAKLRDRVRQEITFEQAHPIDKKVDEEVERRRRAAITEAETESKLPASGLHEPARVDDIKPTAAPKKNWVPAYVLGGVTVATFGTSMVFRALSGAQLKKIEAFGADKDNSYCLNPDGAGCEEQAERIKRQANYANVGDGTLVAAGVGTAATLGYVIYVLAKKPTNERPVRAAVALDKTGGVVSLSGRF